MEAHDDHVVRVAVASDAEAIATLSRVPQELHRQAAPARFKTTDMAALVALFTDELADSDAVILVAETGAQAVGYVYAKVSAQPETAFAYAHTALHVHQLAVSPSHRRGGVATDLMRAIEHEARARNVNEVTLVHWDFNQAAEALFQSLGYTGQSHRMQKALQDPI